jgi:hypothetical protein
LPVKHSPNTSLIVVFIELILADKKGALKPFAGKRVDNHILTSSIQYKKFFNLSELKKYDSIFNFKGYDSLKLPFGVENDDGVFVLLRKLELNLLRKVLIEENCNGATEFGDCNIKVL